MRVLPTSAIVTSFITATLAVQPTAARADLLLGIEFSGNTYLLDSQTGTAANLSPNPFPQANSMARSPGGAFYTATGSQLLTINPATGVASAGPALSLGTQAIAVTGMTFLGSSLYAVNHTVLNDLVTAADFLWLIDPGSGAGSGGLAVGLPGIQALAAWNGILYGWHPAQGLVTIDATTGAVTDPFPSMGTNGIEIQTLAFDGTGALFGAHSAFYSVSLADGSPSFIGQGGYGNLRGMDFVAVTAVPEPSTWMMLGLGLGLMGFVARRRLLR